MTKPQVVLYCKFSLPDEKYVQLCFLQFCTSWCIFCCKKKTLSLSHSYHTQKTVSVKLRQVQKR